MDILSIKKSKLREDLLTLYFINPDKKYYLRELASLLKKPHQTIKPYMEQLVKENILTKIAVRHV